jgi:acetyl esterase/lipase
VAPNAASAPGAAEPARADASSGGMADDGFFGGVDLPVQNEVTFSYGPHFRHRFDAYWKNSDSPRAGVLLLHGGYWMRGDKAGWRGIARLFAARGFAVFSVNYRLTGEAAWPAQRDDAGAALAFIKRGAARFNLDPDRIVAVGSSSGGHLAAMLGTYGAGAQSVAGVVAVSPAASPYQAYVDGNAPDADRRQRRLRDATMRLVGCVPRQGDSVCWQRLQESAVVSHVSAGDARMFLAHATGDFVSSQHSTQLGERLKVMGGSVEMRIMPGAAHGGKLLREPALFESISNWITTSVGP